MHSSHREESGVGVEGIGEPEAELGSEVCRVPDWYVHTSGMLLMQNNEHHVLSIAIAGNAVNHGAVHSHTEWQRT